MIISKFKKKHGKTLQSKKSKKQRQSRKLWSKVCTSFDGAAKLHELILKYPNDRILFPNESQFNDTYYLVKRFKKFAYIHYTEILIGYSNPELKDSH